MTTSAEWFKKKSFGSDNHARVHPKILEAISKINLGTTHSYGEDPITESAMAKFRAILYPKVEVFFVFNGTAANVLGLKSMLQPFEAVLCAPTAHLNSDECGAPEAALGSKLILLPHTNGKLTAESLEVVKGAIASAHGTYPHRVVPKVISITQTTEYGTLYSLDEIRKIADFAHQNGLYLHMDGARIANAAAALNCGLKEISLDAGVDVLSFGGTKNGLLAGEAVIFLNPELGKYFPYIRKQGMQLASKMRFFSAQFEALLEDSLWLKNGAHANRMAQLLAKEVATIPGVQITRKVEANAVFAILPTKIIPLIQKDWFFYIWDEKLSEVRWMTSFDTTEEEVHQFAKLVRSILTQS